MEERFEPQQHPKREAFYVARKKLEEKLQLEKTRALSERNRKVAEARESLRQNSLPSRDLTIQQIADLESQTENEIRRIDDMYQQEILRIDGEFLTEVEKEREKMEPLRSGFNHIFMPDANKKISDELGPEFEKWQNEMDKNNN